MYIYVAILLKSIMLVIIIAHSNCDSNAYYCTTHQSCCCRLYITDHMVHGWKLRLLRNKVVYYPLLHVVGYSL